MKRLNQKNVKNVFTYIDTLRAANLDIENAIQRLEKINGLIIEADRNRKSRSRKMLIKVQDLIDELKDNLHKSDEFKFRR